MFASVRISAVETVGLPVHPWERIRLGGGAGGGTCSDCAQVEDGVTAKATKAPSVRKTETRFIVCLIRRLAMVN